MSQPFTINRDIDNINILFGRKDFIEVLTNRAKSKECVFIRGLRRFGKTCVVKTIVSILKSKGIVYPIFLDFKTDDIQGTDASYKYMIAKLLSCLSEDGIFKGVEKFDDDIEIKANKKWESIEKQLETIGKNQTKSLLKEVLKLFSSLLEKTILFIIDEYEYLINFGLESPSSITKLRGMASESENYFCLWIHWTKSQAKTKPLQN